MSITFKAIALVFNLRTGSNPIAGAIRLRRLLIAAGLGGTAQRDPEKARRRL
jgi:hypothetical protein